MHSFPRHTVVLLALCSASLGFGDCEAVPERSDSNDSVEWSSSSDADTTMRGECAPAAALTCGARVVADTSDFNDGATDVIDGYPVAVGNFAGPEIAYSFSSPTTQPVTLRFVDPVPSELDQDIFVLEAQDGVCAAAGAVARGFNELTFDAVAGRTYYVVVDGPAGVAGEFELDVECEGRTVPVVPEVECDGETVTGDSVDVLVDLATPGDAETIHTTFERIDSIAASFEACGDPRGMFPTSYRHITRRIIEAIEDGEIEDGAWGRAIVLDFAGRFFAALRTELEGGTPSYVWDHYYSLASQDDVSRTRALVVAMVAHLTLDLPHALVAIDTTDDHEDDYFVLGELMIEIVPDFVHELRMHYDTDPADILHGFFVGDWVDGAFGEDTTITLNYQTIRTKAWNSRRLIDSGWGWMADAEIYSAFWALDGALATLDAAGTI